MLVLNGKELKRGDIFYTSWGYDQTNYDYIVVLSISSSGKTAKCQRTSHADMGNESQCDLQMPLFCPFGDVFTMRIKEQYNGELGLRGSYPFCCSGEGSRRLDTFTKAKEYAIFRETDAYSGH